MLLYDHWKKKTFQNVAKGSLEKENISECC